MTFEEWIVGEMDRGLSQLEVDQMRAAWDAATLAEREACAKVAENFDFNKRTEIESPRTLPRYVAASIRKRSS